MSDPGAADFSLAPDPQGDHQWNREPAGRSRDLPLTLIGFYCPVCGFARPAEERLQPSAPTCSGSKARTGRQHKPARMQALLIN